jgi:hypothetical protein
MIAMEMLSEKYSINFDKSFDKSSIDEVPDEKVDDVSVSEECTRRNEEWQKQIDIIVAKHERELAKREHERIDKRNVRIDAIGCIEKPIGHFIGSIRR